MEVVFGLSDGAAPPVQLVGLAALDLLSEAVVLVDDAHWLDRASQDVLGFVARRLTGGTLVATSRTPLFAGVPTLTFPSEKEVSPAPTVPNCCQPESRVLLEMV